MTAMLPSDGPERDLFVTALRDYADRCEAPRLTPSCPFFRVGPQGPWCLDECLEVLSEHPPMPNPDQLVLTAELIARPRRPRARHGLRASVIAYDARRVLLEDDQQTDLARWRPGSLIMKLLDELATPPPSNTEQRARRRNDISQLVGQLEIAGFDTEAIIRDGMIFPTAIAVVMSAAIPFVSVAEGAATELAGFDAPPSEWITLLLGGGRDFTQWQQYALERGPHWAMDQMNNIWAALPRVFNWLATLSVDELADWRPPSTPEFGAMSSSLPVNPSAAARWMLDRFTVTYLERWAPSSLHFEWEYQHGQRIAPCHSPAMRTRHVTEEALALAIAPQAVSDSAQVVSTDLIPVFAFRTMALDHLRSGRRWAAAAIYDAARKASPTNPEAHNNYGFCLLPDDPDGAIDALERAAALGMDSEPVNVANRMLALARTGHPASALEVAERFSSTGLLGRSEFGWLWDPTTTEPIVIDVEDTSEYIIHLAIKIAEEAADDKGVVVWKRRLEQRNA